MTEALGAILAALLLFLASMIGGGILCIIGKDFIKRNIRKRD